MEIEAKAILTSDKQLNEVKKLIKANFANSFSPYESSDTYWYIGGKLVRIRRLTESFDEDSDVSRISTHFITIKDKTRQNGIEINEEKEYSVDPNVLINVVFPLLAENSKTAVYSKIKKYVQAGHLEPAERRFYKIDCGYAWAKDFGDRVPYVEIETITENNESPEAVVNCSQTVRKIFKTLGIEDLITDKSWRDILEE